MNSKPTAFSYSRLTNYEQCPKKYHALSIARSVKEKPNEATDFGNTVHLAFAAFVDKGKPLPLALRQYTALLTKLREQPGEKVVEQKVAVNANYEPTGWFDADVYCRVISDLTILNGPKAAMFDWKTGKPSDDFTQLRLAGAVMFLLAPEIEQISLSYVWLKTRQITTDRLHRNESAMVWTSLAPRLLKYQRAHISEEFPATPGFHCKWCPLTTCPHSIKK